MSVTLTDDLPGVNRDTFPRIGLGPSKKILRELHLIGLTKFSDDAFASLVSRLPALQILNLR